MDTKSIIRNLEKEWDLEAGFLGQLRRGVFDDNGLQRLVQTLSSIQLGGENTIDRRLVSLIWYIPLFMSWQRERIAERGGNLSRFELAINQVTSLVEEILGIP